MEAIKRATVLDAARALSDRDVTHLDLRDPGRTVLRVGADSWPRLAEALAAERSGPPAPEAPRP